MNKKIATLIILAILLIIFIYFQLRSFQKKWHIQVGPSLPGLTLWDINYVKNVHGHPVWRLKVKAAIKDQKNGALKGENINLTVFHKGRPYIQLSADKGTADVKRGIFKVWGNVVIKDLDGNCTVSCNQVTYDEKAKQVYTKEEVNLLCKDLSLKGHGLLVDLKSRSLFVKGLVAASLD